MTPKIDPLGIDIEFLPHETDDVHHVSLAAFGNLRSNSLPMGTVPAAADVAERRYHGEAISLGKVEQSFVAHEPVVGAAEPVKRDK